MKLKGIAVVLTFLIAIGALSGCGNESVGDASSLPFSETESLVIGVGDNFENEYPDYNESVDFSDVSAPVISETSSVSSSAQTSSKTSSDSSVSSVITSTAISSEISSLQASTSTSSSVSSSESTSSKPSSKPSSSQPSGVQNSDKINYSSVKAVWISYIDLANVLRGKSETAFRQNFENVCLNAKSYGINTLICHVRAFGDSIYPSEYFAWSQMAAGVGKNPGYDPLKIMVEISHKHKLSLHAWINPFRTFLDTQVSSVPENTTFKKWYNDSQKNGRYIVKEGTRWFYNPGEPEVRELILSGVVEIVKNYNVDGIHFDDYFYPTTAASFDAKSYSQYGGGKSLADFRRDCVSALVKSVYNAVKKQNKNIVFGISPQANVGNDMNVQYADVKLWAANNGYVDYLCPQAYFNYQSESIDFKEALDTWTELVTASNVKLYMGLSIDRIGWFDYWACSKRDTHNENTPNCGAYGWRTDTPSKSNILARQCTDSLSENKCSGVFLYSYQYLFDLNCFVGDKYASNAKEQAKNEIKELKKVLMQK